MTHTLKNQDMNSPKLKDLPERICVRRLPASELNRLLNTDEKLELLPSTREKPLSAWTMGEDDAQILRYIYRNHAPLRHLEFGTYTGEGVVQVLQESHATVWTVNMPFGEKHNHGIAYSVDSSDSEELAHWRQEAGLSGARLLAGDSFGTIGWKYLSKGLGHRVNQIYCDSRQWETSAYPDHFFDSILIDGGHTAPLVFSDSMKSFRLLRRGGIMLWHDFCPPVHQEMSSVHGVTQGIFAMWERLNQEFEELYWIEPSWLLIGVKRS